MEWNPERSCVATNHLLSLPLDLLLEFNNQPIGFFGKYDIAAGRIDLLFLLPLNRLPPTLTDTTSHAVAVGMPSLGGLGL